MSMLLLPGAIPQAQENPARRPEVPSDCATHWPKFMKMSMMYKVLQKVWTQKERSPRCIVHGLKAPAPVEIH